MIIFKVIGGILLLISGGAAASGTVYLEKKKVSVLEGWIDLILHIRSQIDCYLTPLNDILSGADPELFRAFGGSGFPTGLESLLKDTRVYLNGDSFRSLTGFVQGIGRSYREEQIRLCDYHVAALRKILDQQKSELPAKLKAQISLCLCTAFGALVLLW